MVAADSAPVVVKIGGRLLERPDFVRELGEELAGELWQASIKMVLVHGGGTEVTRWCEKLGVPCRTVAGLRVTDEETLRVVTAVLAGLVNKELVAGLQDVGVQALGLSALDGGIVEIEPHPESQSLGRVAHVLSVHGVLIEALLALGTTPVFASVGATGGRLFNINADDLSAALAVALHARHLIMLSDAPGVVIDGTRIADLAAEEIDTVLALPVVSGGMQPKLRAARAAVSGGVAQVHIGAWNGPHTLATILSGHGDGTTVHAGTLGLARESTHA